MNEEVKTRINNMITIYGTKLSFISNNVNLNQSTLSRFLNDKQELSTDALTRIDKFLKDRNC